MDLGVADQSVLCGAGLLADYASPLTHAHGRSSSFLSWAGHPKR